MAAVNHLLVQICPFFGRLLRFHALLPVENVGQSAAVQVSSVRSHHKIRGFDQDFLQKSAAGFAFLALDVGSIQAPQTQMLTGPDPESDIYIEQNRVSVNRPLRKCPVGVEAGFLSLYFPKAVSAVCLNRFNSPFSLSASERELFFPEKKERLPS